MTTPQPPQQPGYPAQATQPTQPLQPGYPAAPAQPSQPGAPYVAAAQPVAPQASTATTMGETNTYAVLAIVFAFVAPLVGIIFGHLGLSQIKRTGDAGRGLALTGLIVSYAYFLLIAVAMIFYIFIIVAMIGSVGSTMNELSYDLYS